MSGHSKWHNIMHKKEKTDAQRAKIFTKIGKEMSMAIKEAGPNPSSNSKLRDLIAKAKQNNVPNDNIERVIKKASSADAATYEELTYEGYGPSGTAIIVKVTTDNKNRTGPEVRSYFSKYKGNLGQTGCVGYLFTDTGVIIIDNEDKKINEDILMESALEAGASDFAADGDIFEIKTEPGDITAVREALEAKGYKIASSDIDKIPSTYVTLTNEDDVKNMTLLLEKLDENDDVTEVYHNWENE